MSGTCEKCIKSITKGRFPGIKCVLCCSLFHIKCAEISNDILKDLKTGATSWLCPGCRSQSNSSIIDDGTDYCIDIVTDNTVPNLKDMVSILKGMHNQLESLKDSMNCLCHSLDETKVTISGLINDVHMSNNRLTLLENKCEAQEIKINAIEAQLDCRLQEKNQRNIVICGIPSNCQDIDKVVIDLVNLVGVQIKMEDIISITQMTHNKQTLSLLKNSFIVTLKSVDIKNLILDSFRKKKTLFFHELAPDYSMALQNQRIFILHHFTKFQSRIYNAAKNIKNKFKFKFLWCKNNNIYLRETADSKIYHISSFNDTNHFNASSQIDAAKIGTSKPSRAASSEPNDLD